MAPIKLQGSPPVIAIFPWGDVIEEFLGPIGLTTKDFAFDMSGGWLFGYVKALQLAGFEAIIVCASEHAATTSCLTHAGTGARIWIVPGRRVEAGRSPSLHSIRRWHATPIRSFRKVLIREACAAIIVQEYEYTRFDILVALSRWMGIPAYATFQGGDRTLSSMERIVRPFTLRLSDGLIVASSQEHARLRNTYRCLPKLIARIPNPVDTDEWQASARRPARERLSLKPCSFVLITHGRIEVWRKGLDVLLQAWQDAASEDPSSELVIIGSGRDHDEFQSMLSGKCFSNVRWIATYTNDRSLIREWLSAADAYVIASRIEGMPVAPLEAMACRLPIIATEAQGISDILMNGELSGGIMVPVDAACEIARALKLLKHDRRRRERLGRAARQRVVEQFSIYSVSRHLRAMLQDLLPQNGT